MVSIPGSSSMLLSGSLYKLQLIGFLLVRWSIGILVFSVAILCLPFLDRCFFDFSPFFRIDVDGSGSIIVSVESSSSVVRSTDSIVSFSLALSLGGQVSGEYQV